MRLALVGPVYPFRGGIAHYTTALSEVLANVGHQVLLVSFSRQYPQWLFPGRSDRDPSRQLPETMQQVQYWIDSLNPMTWLTAFVRICRFDPDRIVLQWWTPFWAPAWFVLGLLNRLFGNRSLLYICHNVLPHETHWWDVWLAKIVLRWGNRFIVQSEDEKTRLAAMLPGVVPTVIALPAFDMFVGAQPSRDEARRRLGIPQDSPTMLFFGIVREYKGLEDALYALAQARARVKGIRLLVAGEFWQDRQVYEELIQRLGIGDCVQIDDRYIPNEELATYFSAVDVVVAPYRQVTGSAVVQMALAFGCPVITTDIGMLAEQVRPGWSGYLVPPRDVQALAEGMVSFFESKDSLPGIAANQGTSAQSWIDLADVVTGV